MAVNCPNPVDVTTFQFKLQDKLRLCEIQNDLKSNLNLLASASAYGLIFLGNPLKAEIKVLQNQKLIASKEEGFKVPVRTVPIGNVPNNIALSSDDALLAVNYNVQTSTLIEIFDVKSFLSKNVVTKFKIPVATDANAEVVQIVWNPVLCSIFSVILNNGTLTCFNLKENSFELNTAAKHEPAKCACWSPKGKQLVVGFPNGKLVQYKQDMSIARTIHCPGNILEGSFDTIAVQWLSVYQFAAVFLQHGEDMCPNIFIVNAPKTGNPTYISYGDICYSSSGPRQGQVFFKHIQPWNVLLVASANSMEVGILGTNESGEAPSWTQYIPPDEARIELPLNTNKQETHPIGFSLDTSSTHHVMMGETKIPIMPMIHLWSTDGHLVSFNFLNLGQGAPDICSPPQPIADLSGSADFIPYDTPTGESVQSTQPAPAPIAKSQSSTNLGLQMNTPPAAEPKSSLFGGNAFQATPAFAYGSTQGSLFGGLGQPSVAKPSAAPFGSITGKIAETKPNSTSTPAPTFSFAQQPAIGFGAPVEEKSKGILGDKAFGQDNQQLIIKPTAQKFDESNVPPKPLYMATQAPQQQPAQQKPKEPPKAIDKDYMNMYEIDDILTEMIRTEMQAFQIEINNHVTKSRTISNLIKHMENSKTFVKQLNGLQDLSKQATESTESLAMDIHALRQSLTESFAMLAEIRSKLKMFQEPRISRLEIVMPNLNQANQRQITKFQNALATNEVQLQIVAQQIEGLWVNHQDQHDTRKRMRIPSLEIVYQTLATYKDILSREREKIKRLKAKFASFSAEGTTIDSLNDSILSMSLHEKVESESSLLQSEKLKNLRNMLGTWKIMKTKPHRPNRTSLNTEVILEDKIKKAKAPKPKMQQKIAPPELKVKETPKRAESLQSHQTPVSAPRPLNHATKMGFGFGELESVKSEPQKQQSQIVPQTKVTTTPKPKATGLFTGQTSFASLHAGDQKKPELKPFSMPPTQVFQMPTTPDVKSATDAPLFLKTTPSLASNNPPKTASFDLSFSSFGFNTQPSEKTASKTTSLFGESLPNLELKKTETVAMPVATSTQSPAASLSGESTIFKMSEANTDSILDSLKICKPTAAAKPTSAAPSLTSTSTESKSLFGGTGTKSFFDVQTTTASKLTFPQSSGTLFSAPAATSAPAFASLSTAAVTTAATATAATAAAATSTGATSTAATSTAAVTATATVTSQQTPFGLPSMSNFGITSLASTSAPSTAVNLTKPTISFFTTSTASSTTSAPSTPEIGSAQTPTPSSTPSTLTFSFVTGSTAPATNTVFGKPATASTPQLSFAGFSLPAATSITQTSVSTPFKPAFAPATTTAASNLFKEMPKPDQSVFDAVASSTASSTPATTTTATTTATVPFGVPPVSQTPAIGGSVFGTPTSSSGGTVFGTPATSASTGLFGTPTTTATAGAGVFGAPSTTQPSVFSTPATAATTPFGSATSTFGIQTPTTGTSIFGGSTISQSSNIFGGGTLGTATSTSSPFGTPFGAPATTTQTTGGSFFSSSSFGSTAPSGGSVFGGSSAATTQPSAFGSNIFGGGTNQTGTGQTSVFGGSTQPAFGGAAFGGNQQPFGSTAAPAFGQTVPFGQTSPGGTFLQGGPSIAQTGFGSPGSSGFAKPAFGATPSFGGPPTFGSSPTFGGGATFGAPKSTFGGFGTGGGSPTAFSPPTQKNNLFETLGSSDTGPSFGNLAQSAFTNDSAKQQFGGSSFSSWR